MRRPNAELTRRPSGVAYVRHRQAFRRINASKGASESRSFSRRNRIKEGVQRAYKGIRRKSEASGTVSGNRTKGTRTTRKRKRGTIATGAGDRYEIYYSERLRRIKARERKLSSKVRRKLSHSRRGGAEGILSGICQ